MSDIIIKTTNLKAYDALFTMANMYGKSEDYAEYLWAAMLNNEELMKEYIYYLEHGNLLDNMKVCGYTLTDLYVFQIGSYNLFVSDIGKNNSECNKDLIIMDTFMLMAKLINNPDEVINKMNEGRGMDKGFV